MKVFAILERGQDAPKDYKMIHMWIIFHLKIGPYWERLVSWQEVTQLICLLSTHTVASKESVRHSFLAQHNEMDLLSVDVTNAYVTHCVKIK